MDKPYKEIKIGTTREAVQRKSDGAFIPLDPMNSDYQEFLRQATEAGGEANILDAAE